MRVENAYKICVTLSQGENAYKNIIESKYKIERREKRMSNGMVFFPIYHIFKQLIIKKATFLLQHFSKLSIALKFVTRILANS
jgi:hypothetical protein